MRRFEDLETISTKIQCIFHGLYYGELNMTFDKLHCAMGTNVCQLFNDIASSFVLNIMSYNEPTNEEIRAMCDELKEFNEEFKIKEVNTLVKNIKAFLKKYSDKD